MYFIKQMFLSIGAKYVRNTGVETAAQKRHQAFFFEFVLISPLPFIFEFRKVDWGVIGSSKIVDIAFEAGVHNGKVLIRQCDIDNHYGFDFIN